MSLLALLFRVALFWGLLGLLGAGSLFLGLAVAGEDGAAGLQVTCGLLRWSLFLAAFIGLAFEWVQLDRRVQIVDRSVRAHGGSPGARWERWAFHPLTLILGWLGWTGALVVRAIWSEARIHWFAPMWAIGWMFASALVVALALGAWTVWQRRWSVRTIPARERPALPATFPVLAVGWYSLVLVVAFVRLPSLAWVEPLAWAVVVLAEGAEGERGTSRPQEVELLVPTMAGMDDVLRSNGAVATPAITAGTTDDLGLAQAQVVRVPIQNSLVLLWQLAERGVVPELNAPVALDADIEGGLCPYRGAPLVNDPLGVPAWGPSFGLEEALQGLRWPGAPARVAVVDSGVAFHPDLSGVVRGRGRDPRDHGTGVASVAAAVSNNGVGIASTNLEGRFLEVVSYDVLARPNAAADDVADGINSAVTDGASVIVLAFGARGPAPAVVRQAVARATRRDVVVVAAAGNGNGADASEFWPANVPGVLVVGSTWAGGRAPWSNRTSGVAIAVSAPGEGVCVATADGGFELRSGTSYSAPLVAGLVGTYRAMCPGRSRAEVLGDLLATATPGGEVRADRFLGACRGY
jgi:hypothetical protein